MNRPLLTKFFPFSASFSRGKEVHGHNYTLGVTVEHSEKLDEALLEKKVHRSLIEKIHSRDLGLHVEFLRKTEITDLNLLKAFSKILVREIKPARLREVFLERGRTRLSLPVKG